MATSVHLHQFPIMSGSRFGVQRLGDSVHCRLWTWPQPDRWSQGDIRQGRCGNRVQAFLGELLRCAHVSIQAKGRRRELKVLGYAALPTTSSPVYLAESSEVGSAHTCMAVQVGSLLSCMARQQSLGVRGGSYDSRPCMHAGAPQGGSVSVTRSTRR